MSTFPALVLTSFAAGILATAVMLVFLYLPSFWGGMYYDTLGSIAAMFQRGEVDVRGRLAAALSLMVGGVFFAFAYGAYALMFMIGPFDPPPYQIFAGLPTEINVFFLLLGFVAGFGQGIYVSMIGAFVISDFHSREDYRDLYPLTVSFLIGHTVYGIVVTFFQHQFLQLLI